MAETMKKANVTAKPRKKAVKTKDEPANAEASHNSRASHDEIARLAHQYWLERGKQHGSHEEDWLRAEKELRRKAS